MTELERPRKTVRRNSHRFQDSNHSRYLTTPAELQAFEKYSDLKLISLLLNGLVLGRFQGRSSPEAGPQPTRLPRARDSSPAGLCSQGRDTDALSPRGSKRTIATIIARLLRIRPTQGPRRLAFPRRPICAYLEELQTAARRRPASSEGR